MSDLHLEFHADKGVGFIKAHKPVGEDVLVLPGDVLPLKHRDEAVKYARLIRDAAQVPVVYVAGNHEYYGSNPFSVRDNLKAVVDEVEGFHHLDCGVLELAGKRFIGGTMWFPELGDNQRHEYALSDFSLIRKFKPWVYEQHERFKNLLKNYLKEGDIVVSHHLPSYRCVADKFAGSELNRFFAARMDPYIRERKPGAWFFGHTHTHVDLDIDGCRVVANPLGYPSEGGVGYVDDLVIEIP
jgi:Icc-related predicted phosphoesterase